MKRESVVAAARVVPDNPHLINAVSKRVRQLNAGAHPLIETDPRMDTADIALLEIAQGKLAVHPPEPVPRPDEAAI